MTPPSTEPTPTSDGRVSVSEICRLIAWMRHLPGTGLSQADPAELAAFHHAKHDLLTRIAGQQIADQGITGQHPVGGDTP